MVHTMLQDASPLPGLYCEDLPPGQAGTVFPLLREAIPGLQLQSWLRFARRVTSPRRAGQSGELELLAQRLGCGGIRTMVIEPDAPFATRLLAAGHASDGAAMWKPVDGAQAEPPPRKRR